MSTTALMIPPTVKIPLDKGYFAIVDEADAPRILQHRWQAHIGSKGIVYAVRFTATGKRIGMQYCIKRCPKNKRLDHKNGNGLCNTKRNLRPATFAQNARNRIKNRNGGSSKYKGVSWDAARGKWLARITKDYKGIGIGRYDTEEQAAIAYNLKARELFGAFAKENSIKTPIYGRRGHKVTGKNISTKISDYYKKRRFKVVFNGQAKWLPAWAKETGIPHQTLRKRLARGWNVQDAFTTPIRLQNSHPIQKLCTQAGTRPFSGTFESTQVVAAECVGQDSNLDLLIRSQTHEHAPNCNIQQLEPLAKPADRQELPQM